MEDNVILEHLRSIRDDIAKLSAKVDNLAAETHAVKTDVAALVRIPLS